MRLALFLPCVVDQWAPEVGLAVARLLDHLEVSWYYPEEQTCCGQFALTAGNVPAARRLMRHFFRVFGGAEAVLSPSASCTLMVRHHYPRLAESREESRLARALADRTWELGEFLAAQGPLPWQTRHPGTLALHRSCKAGQLGVLPAARGLLSRVEGLRVTEVPPSFSCCGFGGVFHRQHPHTARVIGEAYLEAVLATGATGLVSPDWGCFLHLKPLAAAAHLPVSFHYLAELLLPASFG
ncbi:MAG: (Fe-S)-binding protein [Syntrophobacterales bacterium]|nr:(Fe-S)-binding protein [Syntrophobacterales bacterium]